MRRLAVDADLRRTLGGAARAFWQREHSLEAMADDYGRVVLEVRGVRGVREGLPVHLRTTGEEKLQALLAPFGIDSPL
jgi:hypothetical protein